MSRGGWAFCQAGSLCYLTLAGLGDRGLLKWRLADAAESSVSRASAAHRTLSSSGVRIVARSNGIAHVLTSMLKSSGPWFAAGRLSFNDRKYLALKAFGWIRPNVQLVEASVEHLSNAGRLWIDHYKEELQHQRAGFEDYLDAAVVLRPPARWRVGHVIVDHGHLPYILGKCDHSFNPHYVT